LPGPLGANPDPRVPWNNLLQYRSTILNDAETSTTKKFEN